MSEDEAVGMRASILFGQSLLQRRDKIIERMMETIGNRQVLQVQPETLNGIEERTVFR